MLKRITLFLLCVTLFSTALACNKTTLTFASPKTPIIAREKDSVFTIALKSNPAGTGFSWKIKSFNHKVLRTMGHKYVSPKTKLIGAPGYQVFMFQAKHSAFGVHKQTKIVMEYARPWTEKGKTDITLTVKLIQNKK